MKSEVIIIQAAQIGYTISLQLHISMGRVCRLEVYTKGVTTPLAVAENRDIFDCLCEVRSILAGKHIKPLIVGAQKDVYPTGMGRSMAQGRKAYRLKRGKPTSLKDLVDIFEPCPKGTTVSVAAQREHFESWKHTIC
jgi:hypothetical protein